MNDREKEAFRILLVALNQAGIFTGCIVESPFWDKDSKDVAAPIDEIIKKALSKVRLFMEEEKL